MSDDDETKPNREQAYAARQKARGYSLIKVWVPTELREKFFASASDARAMKRELRSE